VGDRQKYTNGGAQLKGKCTNSNSISIEMVSHTDSKGNYYIPEATINHAVELTRALMSKYHIPSSNVVTHHMCTGKLCPRPMCYDTAGKAKWTEFKAKLTGVNQAPQKEEEEMTQEQFNSMMKEYRKTLQDNDCNAYSAEAREWAIKNGIVTGSGKDAKGDPNYMWADQLSREQAVTIFYRFAKLMGKA
jgi:N-acetylmuramoyl-L-alanine amidase CwlA